MALKEKARPVIAGKADARAAISRSGAARAQAQPAAGAAMGAILIALIG